MTTNLRTAVRLCADIELAAKLANTLLNAIYPEAAPRLVAHTATIILDFEDHRSLMIGQPGDYAIRT